MVHILLNGVNGTFQMANEKSVGHSLTMPVVLSAESNVVAW